MLNYVLMVMMALAPQQSQEQLLPQGEAIARASRTEAEAAVLISISFYETSFHPERAAWISPFGLTASYPNRNMCAPMWVWAVKALHIMERAERICGRNYTNQLGYFHNGFCGPDAFSTMEANRVRRVLAAFSTEFQGQLACISTTEPTYQCL